METVALGAVGLTAGFLSGFFGIGGGTVSVPLLLLLDIPIKFAVGISAMQMVFGSLFGSLINILKGNIKPLPYLPVGLGGIVGAWIGAHLLDRVDGVVIGYIFLALILFALFRVYFSREPRDAATTQLPPFWVMGLLGIGLGVFSGLLGVGGAILLIPILVGFFGVGIKEAVAAGLFFVIFSSISGFSTLAWLGYVDYAKGAVVAVVSLAGVRAGIWLGRRTSVKRHRRLVVVMYLGLALIVGYKVL